MASESRNGDSADFPAQPVKDSSFSSPDEIITFARAISLPTPQTLKELIAGQRHDVWSLRPGKVPDDGLRSHMFGCSECFQEHHNALVAIGRYKRSSGC